MIDDHGIGPSRSFTKPGPPDACAGKSFTISHPSSSAYEISEAVPQPGMYATFAPVAQAGHFRVGIGAHDEPGARVDVESGGRRVEHSTGPEYRLGRLAPDGLVHGVKHLVSVVSPISELDHPHAAAHTGAGDRYGVVDVRDVEDRHRPDVGYGVINVQSGLAGQVSYPITLQPAVRSLPVVTET